GDPVRRPLEARPVRGAYQVAAGQHEPAALPSERPLLRGDLGHLVGGHRREVRSRGHRARAGGKLRHPLRQQGALRRREGRGMRDSGLGHGPSDRYACGEKVALALRAAPRTASATAAPTSEVEALPFISGVCGPSMITRSIARTMSAAASGCPRCSSISAPDQIAAIGLAIFFPAMSGAEPCTGSKIDGAVRSGLMLPEAAMPMVPAVAGPRSE